MCHYDIKTNDSTHVMTMVYCCCVVVLMISLVVAFVRYYIHRKRSEEAAVFMMIERVTSNHTLHNTLYTHTAQYTLHVHVYLFYTPICHTTNVIEVSLSQ